MNAENTKGNGYLLPVIFLSLMCVVVLVERSLNAKSNDPAAGGPVAKGTPIKGTPIKGTPIKQAVTPKPKDSGKTGLDKKGLNKTGAGQNDHVLKKPDTPEKTPAKVDDSAKNAEPKDLTAKGPIKKPIDKAAAKDPAKDPATKVTDQAASDATVPEGAKIKDALAKSGFKKLSFELLSSYEFVPPPPGVTKDKMPKQIPDKVTAYDGQIVEVIGYMMPIDINEEGDVELFFVMKDLAACCFGGSPKMTDWVLINMVEGASTKYTAYSPIGITGRISIGEKIEYGRVTSIYRMDCVKVEKKG